jgi:hypothetical protein
LVIKHNSAHSPCSLLVLNTLLELSIILSNKKRGHMGRALAFHCRLR